jgi:capsular exopolysaccharide synthesis family protein
MRQRVLLIDGDLRRPMLHKLLDVTNASGLADVLSGASTFKESVRSTAVHGLDLLTSGTPLSTPAHLLQSGDFDELLREAKADGYQRIIIDLPAVMPVVDAAAVAEKLDGTILVVSAATTDAESARQAVSYVEGLGITNLLGLVVNRVRRETGADAAYYVATQGGPLALP